MSYVHLSALHAKTFAMVSLEKSIVDGEKLPRENGVLLLSDSNLLRTFDGVCIFEGTCRPRSSDFKALNPPKSISIKGQTGWTNSYAYRDKGGGGMMG